MLELEVRGQAGRKGRWMSKNKLELTRTGWITFRSWWDECPVESAALMKELITLTWLKSWKRRILGQVEHLEARLCLTPRRSSHRSATMCVSYKNFLQISRGTSLVRNIQEEEFWELRALKIFNEVDMVMKIPENHLEKAVCILAGWDLTYCGVHTPEEFHKFCLMENIFE